MRELKGKRTALCRCLSSREIVLLTLFLPPKKKSDWSSRELVVEFVRAEGRASEHATVGPDGYFFIPLDGETDFFPKERVCEHVGAHLLFVILSFVSFFSHPFLFCSVPEEGTLRVRGPSGWVFSPEETRARCGGDAEEKVFVFLGVTVRGVVRCAGCGAGRGASGVSVVLGDLKTVSDEKGAFVFPAVLPAKGANFFLSFPLFSFCFFQV